MPRGVTRIRLTPATLDVIETLPDATAEAPVWGFKICETTKRGPGTVYPILDRLDNLGWLEFCDEEQKPDDRPRRRYVALNNTGRKEVAALKAARSARGAGRLGWVHRWTDAREGLAS